VTVASKEFQNLNIFSAAALGAIVFVSSNVDDMLLLFGFFADPKFRGRDIVLGQYLGMGALYLASALASLGSLVLDRAYVGLLGAVPIAIGVKRLIGQKSGYARSPSQPARAAKSGVVGPTLTVAAVTIASGADNLGIYIPLFATQSRQAIAVMGAMFVLMTALWCIVAHWLVWHPALGATIRRYGHRVMPYALIGLGLFILAQSDSWRLLAP